MSKPTVHHCKREAYDIYIGRANGTLPQSKRANPWVIGKDGTREEVIARYADWIKTQPELMAALPELAGKRLGCWCKGTNGMNEAACHGDVLARLVGELEGEANGWTSAPQEVAAVAGDKTFIEQMSTLGPVEYIELGSAVMPVFSSHYGLDSILTFDEAGSTEPGNPVSIIDIARANHLKQVIVNDFRIDGFLEAYKNLSKPFKPTPPKTLAEYLKAEQGDKKTASDEDRAKAQVALDEATAKYEREKTWSTEPIQLIYGVKMVVVPDMKDKTAESMRQESKIVIFIRNSQGYKDLLKIWNRAWVEGSFSPPRESSYGRVDWTTLAANWTQNMSLALPFFSSFLAKNTLHFSSIVPSLPVPASEVTLLREVDSGLPFADLLDEAVNRFAADTGAQIQAIKSVYYADKQAFDAYVTYRAILNRGEFSRPEVPHLCSDNFCFSEWLRLTKETT